MPERHRIRTDWANRMGLACPVARTKSLAMTRPGDHATVEEILFDTVRMRCDELGIQEGNVLFCRERGSAGVRVELSRGRVVEVPLEHAKFISVCL